MKSDAISVLRSPREGSYVIVDSSGTPWTLPCWSDAVQILLAITMETDSEIQEIKPDIDAGAMKRLRYREPMD